MHALLSVRTDTHAVLASGRQAAALLMFVFSVIFHSHKAAREASDVAQIERFSSKTYLTQFVTGPAAIWRNRTTVFAACPSIFHPCFTPCLSLFPLISLCHNKTSSSDLSGREPWTARDRRSWRTRNRTHSWVLQTWQPSVYFFPRVELSRTPAFFFFQEMWA